MNNKKKEFEADNYPIKKEDVKPKYITEKKTQQIETELKKECGESEKYYETEKDAKETMESIDREFNIKKLKECGE